MSIFFSLLLLLVVGHSMLTVGNRSLRLDAVHPAVQRPAVQLGHGRVCVRGALIALDAGSLKFILGHVRWASRGWSIGRGVGKIVQDRAFGGNGMVYGIQAAVVRIGSGLATKLTVLVVS